MPRRFVLLQVGNLKIDSKLKIKNSKLTSADKKILLGLRKLQNEIEKHIEKYEFGKAIHGLYDFFWHKYADVYIETVKNQLINKKIKTQTQKVLLKVHSDMLKLLHPFLPFITEEIWQILIN